MGDPICKWRNASVETTMELVSALPKKEMKNSDFRDYMNESIYGKAFNRTAYQLASQLGLYYIDQENIYHPRFNHDIDKTEAEEYLHHWIKHYYVPNPYTAKKFDGMDYSVILLYAIVDFVKEYPHLANLKTSLESIFGESIGNLLCVKYALNNYSNILEIDKDNEINLLMDVEEDYYVTKNRNDKKAFFESFNH